MSTLNTEVLNEIARKIAERGDVSRYTGFKMMPNRHLTVPGPDQVVVRAWRERLFSWPWRPLQKTKVIKTMIPDPQVYITNTPEMIKTIGFPAMFGHPETLDRVKKAMISEVA